MQRGVNHPLHDEKGPVRFRKPRLVASPSASLPLFLITLQVYRSVFYFYFLFLLFVLLFVLIFPTAAEARLTRRQAMESLNETIGDKGPGSSQPVNNYL